MYRYNTEASFLEIGIVLARCVHDPGSVSDLTMLPNMDHFHRRATKKTGHVCKTPDYGPLRILSAWTGRL